MTENPKLGDMVSGNMGSNCEVGELGEKEGQRVSVTKHVNGLQHSSTNSESFVLDMERFAHIIDKDINANSRITLQRNLSRKGTIRVGEKKTIANGNERDTGMLATSPKAALHGGSTPEKLAVGAATDRSIVPQVHHQITISNGSVNSNNAHVAAAENKIGGRRLSFRRSPSTWTIDPRRILLFFATLSCVGTILLIYFTLSMGKLSRDDSIGN